MTSTAFTIIYQDHHLLIVDKPAGVVIHPTYKHVGDTMWDAILSYLGQQGGGDDWRPSELPDDPLWASAPEHVQVMLREKRTERLEKEEGLLERPCLLHRLDKDTSGIVALARTGRACRHIVHQFEEHTIIKRYLAVVQKGAPEWARPRAPLNVTGRVDGKKEEHLATPVTFPGPGTIELVVEGSLQRDPADRRRCIVGPDGQYAKTVCKVLAVEGDFTLLEARPITGRTHQIRAHLAALGYPIVGDKTYALPAANGTPRAALGRQFLHAYSLELRRYPDNALCTFVAPLADDLVTWLEHYFPTASGALHARETLSA